MNHEPIRYIAAKLEDRFGIEKKMMENSWVPNLPPSVRTDFRKSVATAEGSAAIILTLISNAQCAFDCQPWPCAA